MVLFSITATLTRADATLQDRYLTIYVKLHDADNLQTKKDYLGALLIYKRALLELEIMRFDPSWERALLEKRIQGCKETITHLTPLATKQLLAQPNLADPAGPDQSTLFDEGFKLAKEQRYWGALDQFEQYITIVEIMRHIDPKWDTPSNAKRMGQVQAETERLKKIEIQLQEKPYQQKP